MNTRLRKKMFTTVAICVAKFDNTIPASSFLIFNVKASSKSAFLFEENGCF